MVKLSQSLYHNPIAMINLMLNNLRCPPCILLALLFPVHILIFHFYFLISGTFSHTSQRQASFFCLIFSGSFYNLWIEHCYIHESHIDSNDTFFYPNHISCHTNTAFFMRFQCVQKIYCYLLIGFSCRF